MIGPRAPERIEASIAHARRALELDGRGERGFESLPVTDELFALARAHLLEGPHRFEPLSESAPDEAVATLEGLLNLRLAITHLALDPLDVGEARAKAAAKAVAHLDRIERALAASATTSEDVRLRYETSRFLDPPPPFTGAPSQPASLAHLPDLVARWERVRARPEPLGPWLRRKAKQHLQFYRIGFGAGLYEARRARIHRALPASIRGHSVALETFSALEQLGPVLDNFVFDRGLRAAFVDGVGVADYAFLYMQLADELVDNLVKLAGESGLRALLDAHYGPEVRASCFVPLEELDAGVLRGAGVDPEARIAKYDVTVSVLVGMLADLRAVLLASIARLDRASSLRDEVSAFFRHCFATFLDELELARLSGGGRLDLLPYASVAWHYHRKNHEVMSRWLALRARILGLDPRAHADALSRWGVLLASFQIFDDLKDVAVDLGHQPCYPIELAHRFHPEELRFLEQDFGARDRSLDRNEVAVLNVGMAATVRDCIRWSRLLALSSFDWFVDYVSDYRWRRNWLLRKRSFHLPPTVDVPIEQGPLADHASIATGVPVVDAVFRYLAATHARLCPGELDDSTLGFVVDVVAYDHASAFVRALLPDVPAIYRFVNLRMRMDDAEKAEILRRLLRRHRPAAAHGLLLLRRETGSLDLTHRVARALGMPVAAGGRQLGAPLSGA